MKLKIWTLAMLLAGALGSHPANAQDGQTAEKVAVGSPAPGFTAANDKEELVDLQDLLDANDQVILVFVRAHW